MLWLTGGVAVDFLVGRWTRPHKDLDLVAFAPDRQLLEVDLERYGVVLAQDGAWTTRWTVADPALLGITSNDAHGWISTLRLPRSMSLRAALG